MQAASRDGIITESLENLERDLGESASVAGGESTGPGGRDKAGPSELLAELATLRRAVEEAQLNAARNGATPGNGRDQNGQPQTGQQQGGQVAGGSIGGAWNGGGGPERFGAWRGNDPHLIGGARDWTAIGSEARLSSERLAELRGRIERGSLPDADLKTLQELADRLRRAGNDPMANEYRRMMALVDQLELAALRAGGDPSKAKITRGNARTDEPARFRENVAEYYRRLGEKEQR
jgi:hypothetical protein